MPGRCRRRPESSGWSRRNWTSLASPEILLQRERTKAFKDSHKVVGVLFFLTWRWSRWRLLGRSRRRRLRRPLLLSRPLDLGHERRRVHPAAVELALEGEQVLGVVLLERVGAAGGGADAKLGGDVLPRLVFCALEGEKGKHVENTAR